MRGYVLAATEEIHDNAKVGNQRPYPRMLTGLGGTWVDYYVAAFCSGASLLYSPHSGMELHGPTAGVSYKCRIAQCGCDKLHKPARAIGVY
jgi:hypothetical protein